MISYPPLYLEFIQLFNERKFFEAHEVLERFWRQEKGPNRQFYQGLIQAAAVFVHLEKKNDVGAGRLYQTASAYLEPYGRVYQGLNLESLLDDMKQALGTGRVYLEKTLILETPREQS